MTPWNPFQRRSAAAGPSADAPLFRDPVVRPHPFRGGIALVVFEGGYTGFLHRSGHALEGRHSHTGHFSEGLCAVENPIDLVDTLQSHYIDTQGRRVAAIAPRIWSTAGDFHEGLAMISEAEETPQGLKDRYGYIDRSGAIAIALQFDWAGDFHGGLAPVRQGRQWGFVDTQGRMVITLAEGLALSRSPHFSAFHEGMVVMATVGDEDGVSAGLRSRWGYLDRSGRVVVPPVYQEARPFAEGLGCVAQGEDEASTRWGFVDTQGQHAIALQYEWAHPFSMGLATVRQQDRWGYIDTRGERVIACQYRGAGDFGEGLAPVQGDDGLWGYIDRHDRVRIPFQYETAGSFSEGLAAVQSQGQWHYIDALGQVFFHVGPVGKSEWTS